MKNLVAAIVLVSIFLLVLAIPIIFVFEFEARFFTWIDSPSAVVPQPQITFLIFGLLASDIVLPIPSSGIMTFAGAQLGFAPGVLVCWLATNTSVVIAYALSRSFGNAFVNRFAKPDSLAQANHWLEKNGAAALVILRCVPVLAESSVIVAGLYRMSFWKVVISTFVANLAIAAVYCGVGFLAQKSDWLPVVIVVCILIPLAFFLLLKPLTKNNSATPQKSLR